MAVLRKVIASREQPLRIDAERTDDSRNDINEEGNVYRCVSLVDECTQSIRFHSKVERQLCERTLRCTLHDRAQALSNSGDERIVVGERQEFSARWVVRRTGELAANRMLKA